MYAKWIDRVRLAVAIAMAICGLGAVICINRDDYLTGTLRYQPGIWRWGSWAFGIGVAACFIATFALVIEYLARPIILKPFAWRSFLVRASIIFVVLGVVGVLMTFTFGPIQGTGAVIGTSLLLAALLKPRIALRESYMARITFAFMALIVFGLIVWSTQLERRSEKSVHQRTANPLPACQIQNS